MVQTAVAPTPTTHDPLISPQNITRVNKDNFIVQDLVRGSSIFEGAFDKYAIFQIITTY